MAQRNNYVQKFVTGGTLTDALIYDTGTAVGIGTETPAGLFEVIQTAPGSNTIVARKDSPAAAFNYTTVGGTLQVRNLDATNGNYAGVDFVSTQTTLAPQVFAAVAAVFSDHADGAFKGDLTLLTANGGNPTEKVRVLASGDVRIGTNNRFLYGVNTSSVARKLIGITGANAVEIAGDGQDILTGSGTVGIGGPSSGEKLQVSGRIRAGTGQTGVSRALIVSDTGNEAALGLSAYGTSGRNWNLAATHRTSVSQSGFVDDL